ncbi:MAG: hypothetical protein ACPG32_06220 [Akkermansiaceae bacterium]
MNTLTVVRAKTSSWLISKDLPAGVDPGYRRIDHVIGIAVDVVLDGKIIKSVANSDKILAKHKEKFVK